MNGREHIPALLKKQGGRCFYCGEEILDDDLARYRNRKSATIDHIIPKNKGGSSCITNLVASCFLCNTIKCSHDFAYFINCLTCSIDDLYEHIRLLNVDYYKKREKVKATRKTEKNKQVLIPRFIILWKYCPDFARVFQEELRKVSECEGTFRVRKNWLPQVIKIRKRREKNKTVSVDILNSYAIIRT